MIPAHSFTRWMFLSAVLSGVLLSLILAEIIY